MIQPNDRVATPTSPNRRVSASVPSALQPNPSPIGSGLQIPVGTLAEIAGTHCIW